MATIAERLKSSREKQGLSVSDLSHIIHVARSTIYTWESGQSKPSRANLQKLARALAVSAYELEYGDQANAVASAIDEARKLVAEVAGVPIDKVVVKIKR